MKTTLRSTLFSSTTYGLTILALLVALAGPAMSAPPAQAAGTGMAGVAALSWDAAHVQATARTEATQGLAVAAAPWQDPASPDYLPAAAIAAGLQHTCALTVAGAVKCWGHNGAGQLGNGTTSDSSTPVNVLGLANGVVAMAAGGAHTCALTTVGGVKCWGYNYHGQLGDGTTTDSSTPVDVVGLASGVVAIAGGDHHTCALTTGGGVKCWGDNYYGQLGDGTTTKRSTPVNVVGLASGATVVDAGGDHTCAVTTGGGVKCWGSNDNGQLGNGTTNNSTTPVDVVGLSGGVVAVSAGGARTAKTGSISHTCALSAGGAATCWGANYYGQLGDGTYSSWNTPVDVVGLSSGVTLIVAGGYHTCALTTGGGVKCWGDNYYGQLGDGTTMNRNTPVDTADLASGVSAASTGFLHTCALTTDGGVKCWGWNWAGQLGDGTTNDSLTPVDVVGFTNPTILQQWFPLVLHEGRS